MTKLLRTAMLFALSLLVGQSAMAQNFLEPTESFSIKKTAYITLKNGKEVEGQFRNVKTKKGLFLKVYIRTDKEKKMEIEADDIQHMYLPASGWDKMAKALDMDATKWDDDSSLNQELVKDGYAYFESVKVMVKKKKRVALMQLLNPAYASKVRVFHNPWASESASLGIGGIKVAGGDSKSFYVQVGKKTAFLLKKKDYSDKFKSMFGDCKEFMKDKKKPRWPTFEQDVYDHSVACEEEVMEEESKN